MNYEMMFENGYDPNYIEESYTENEYHVPTYKKSASTLEQKIDYMKPEKWTGATVFITELEESSDVRIINELEHRIIVDSIGKPNDLYGFSTWDLIEELEYRGYGEGYEEIIRNCC